MMCHCSLLLNRRLKVFIRIVLFNEASVVPLTCWRIPKLIFCVNQLEVALLIHFFFNFLALCRKNLKGPVSTENFPNLPIGGNSKAKIIGNSPRISRWSKYAPPKCSNRNFDNFRCERNSWWSIRYVAKCTYILARSNKD